MDGGARFEGGDTEGALTGGTLRVMGSFNQSNLTSGGSFAAQAGHLTILGGSDVTLGFNTPGDRVGTSHFGTLRLDIPGDLTLLSDVYGLGPLVTTGPTAPIVSGGGHQLVFQGLDVFRLVLDNAPLASNFGLLRRFEDVIFQRFGELTPLTILHTGQEAPFALGNLDFGPTGRTQIVLSANDPPDTLFALRLDVTATAPADGCPQVVANGDASITWNGVPCP